MRKTIVFDGSAITSKVNSSNPQIGDPCHTLHTDSRNYLIEVMDEKQCYAIENHPEDSRVKVDEDAIVQSLTSRMGTGGGNTPIVLIALGGTESNSAITDGTVAPCMPARAGTGGWNEPIVLMEAGTTMEAYMAGNGQMHQVDMESVSGTLDCMHDQKIIVGSFWDGNQIASTLTAKGAGGDQRMPDKDHFTAVIEQNREDNMEGNNQKKYVLRRLTPTECARLQGFPDWWCDGANGSDSAQYKMWGNGIALPCAADVLGRIAEELQRAE